ncbi:GNAT family N-acetyltransferase [Pedobacter gandavensis]|uniref:GNAT family N-acetyltransferase n=1 Tax=Pedobacter gandavensis TaxID=2679963 RepID=UPI002930CB46|nr:GNAT family N-acetyltransferase [Pedobacter gandavensis]
MENKIKTKFTVASEEGIAVLQMLGEKRGQEKYGRILSVAQLEDYLFDKFNTATIVNHLNTFSNQLIVVYVEDQPAGYAYLSGNGRVPQEFQDKRVIHLQDFEVLNAYQGTSAKEILLEKCLNVCKSYEVLRLTVNTEAKEMISFYERYGFQQKASEEISMAGIKLQLAVLIKVNP